ncbi:MAG: adenosylmethionine--8-amino-7-oxononanoate transaminase [Chitinispirillales bacterium]|jgi:adenosylmethionine-8-amino-7-oxononanoate aminotransferase|nr:adenosylmethionine--8-amino-7-oxononanoate transaminase [Chitinispirillales bacterium]
MKSLPAFDRLWMPFTSHQDYEDCPPVVINRGEGIYLYDTDGKRYIDAVGSWWVSSFGHCNPEISAAVKAQLDKLEHVMMAGFISDATMELTAALSEILPKQLTKTFYSDNGSTAVEVAMKIAIQYHALRGSERRAFVSLGGGYHGDTLGAMSVGAIPLYHDLFHKRFKEQYFTASPYCFRCPAGKCSKDCDADCMNSLAHILEQRGNNIAACVFEPMVQGAAGMRIYPTKVLRQIFDLCRQYGVITIADEVATGLGRTGKMFACDHVGITPDIMCVAKGLTGGYLPIAVTAVSEEIYSEFKGDHLASNRILNHGHTFTGNPLASSAAVAAIKLTRENALTESARASMAHFSEMLKHLDDRAHISGIRSLGFVGAFELVKDKNTKQKFPPEARVAFKLSQKALEKGLILRPLGDTVYFMPPFNVTAKELDEIFTLTKEALNEALASV